MTDTSNAFDEAAHAAAYHGVRQHVTDLVRAATPERLDAMAPATPQWRARDIVSHLTGVATDIVNGNVADAAADHWTAAQVAARYDNPVGSLLEEWDDSGTQVDAIILALPTAITGQLVADAVTHEHDLRHALGRPGERDSDALVIGVTWVISALAGVYDAAGMPATRFESELVTATAGTGVLDCTVRASAFELGRAIAGRRTVSEIVAYEWTPEPRPDRVLALPLFRPPTTSLGE